MQVQGGETAWLCVSGLIGVKREASRIDSCLYILKPNILNLLFFFFFNIFNIFRLKMNKYNLTHYTPFYLKN